MDRVGLRAQRLIQSARIFGGNVHYGVPARAPSMGASGDLIGHFDRKAESRGGPALATPNRCSGRIRAPPRGWGTGWRQIILPQTMFIERGARTGTIPSLVGLRPSSERCSKFQGGSFPQVTSGIDEEGEEVLF